MREHLPEGRPVEILPAHHEAPASEKVTSRISRTVTDAPSGASQPAKGTTRGSAGGRRWQIESTVDDPGQSQWP
jgi:hypothetical protein